jgi:hypothetical protein
MPASPLPCRLAIIFDLESELPFFATVHPVRGQDIQLLPRLAGHRALSGSYHDWPPDTPSQVPQYSRKARRLWADCLIYKACRLRASAKSIMYQAVDVGIVSGFLENNYSVLKILFNKPCRTF